MRDEKKSLYEKNATMSTLEFFVERGAEADIELAKRRRRRPGGHPSDAADRLP